jgi:hypothetical protein
LALFRSILRAVKRSEWHMSNRAYQMPESLFLSPERRDRWTQEATHPTQRTTTSAQSTLPKAQPLANGSYYVGG